MPFSVVIIYIGKQFIFLTITVCRDKRLSRDSIQKSKGQRPPEYSNSDIAGRCPLVLGETITATNIAGRCPLVLGRNDNSYKYCGALPLFGRK
jgi:hypothetical protein